MSSLVSKPQQTLQMFIKLGGFCKYHPDFNDVFQLLKTLTNIADVIIFIAQVKTLMIQNINQMFSMIGIKIPDEELRKLMEEPVETYQKLLNWYEFFTKNLTDNQQFKYRERYGETFVPTDDILVFLKEFYSPQLFKIYIKTLTGRKFELVINSQTTIDELHGLITDNDGIPAEQQRLIFAGKQLESKRLAGDYAITKESIIHLNLRLRGGMLHEISTGRLRNAYESLKEELRPELLELLEEIL